MHADVPASFKPGSATPAANYGHQSTSVTGIHTGTTARVQQTTKSELISPNFPLVARLASGCNGYIGL